MTATFDDVFGKRRWRVLTELSGETSVNGSVVTFSKGHFTVGEGGCFQSPISPNKGKSGVALQEITPDGQDIPGSIIPVGERVLPRIRAAGALH